MIRIPDLHGYFGPESEQNAARIRPFEDFH
jgi:hypothetical protein